MQAHFIESAGLPDSVQQAVELYRRGGELDPATGNTRLANHLELGRLERAASKQQRVIERLFDPHIKPGINTPTQKLN